MTSEEVVKKVKAGLADVIQDIGLPQGDAVVFVAPDSLSAVTKFLKNDLELKFDYLSDIRGVDYLLEEREPRFEVVYQLYSIDHHRGSEEQQPNQEYYDPDLINDYGDGINTLPFFIETLEKSELKKNGYSYHFFF